MKNLKKKINAKSRQTLTTLIILYLNSSNIPSNLIYQSGCQKYDSLILTFLCFNVKTHLSQDPFIQDFILFEILCKIQLTK